ncbi:phosphatidylglycerol lysyltransferase domain-containing protein [Halobacteriovorax sp.]|uniref:phosphatidylglycerol lysyltransferase domain-containing protein n=1 Tax=Halobacteriovorax sp. TaxID=2020862 RepID=UPI0035625ADA
MTSDRCGIALVVGASFTGLLTAKVLSGFYKEVIILDKGGPAEGPTVRKSVPQMGQHHILLSRGRSILENILPGIDGELSQYGSELIDYVLDGRLFTEYGECPRFESNIMIRPTSRVLLDYRIRERVRSVKNINIIYNAKWNNLILNSDKSKVLGVKYLTNGEEKSLSADLIIDASGRNSSLIKTFEKNDISVADSKRVNPYVGYATCAYEIPESLTDFKLMEIASAAPSNPRAAGLWKIEGNKWLLALIGSNKEYPSADPDEFLEFARKLTHPHIYNIIKKSKPISDISLYRGPVNEWRQFSKMKNFPNQLLVLGDALATFNPLYGQGMSIALTEILLVQELLKDNVRTIGKKHQLLINNKVKAAWPMAISEDLKWPLTDGSKITLHDKISIWYSELLLPLSTYNKRVVMTFLQIANLEKDPYALVSPSILKDIVAHYLFKNKKMNNSICTNKLEELVTKHGQHTNSHMSLQDGVEFYEVEELGVVLYKKHRSIFGDINLIFINPLCEEKNISKLIDSFEHNTPGKSVYIGNDYKVASHLKNIGYSMNQFGSEVNIPLDTFNVSGKKMKYLRNVRNLHTRGLSVHEQPWSDVDQKTVLDISKRWMSKKKVKTGELKLLSAPPRFFESWKERKFYCYDKGKLIAYVFFIPYFKNGKVYGYCAHILRNLPGTTSGSLDFIILKAIEKFKEEGVKELSLGIAPLYDIEKIEGDHFLTRVVMRFLYKFGNSLYSFKALAFHKERYRGNKVKMYYCSRDVSLARSVWAILLKTGIIGNEK